MVSPGDLRDFSALLAKIKGVSHDLSLSVRSIEGKVSQEADLSGKGISFLDTKNQCMLQYLTDLCSVILTKTSGGKVAGSAAVKRLIETRVALEKMRPIDKKLRYQIDKCIRVANTGTLGSNDPLSYKSNPQSLAKALEDEHSGEDEEEKSSDMKKSKVYQPPRLTAVHYDQESETVRKETELKKSRARAMNSAVMRDLKEDFSEEPMEIHSAGGKSLSLSRRLAKEAEERRNYEEDYHVRLTTSKKTRHKELRSGGMSDLNAITNFGALSAVTGSAEGGKRSGGKRKKQTGKKGKGKKRRFH